MTRDEANVKAREYLRSNPTATARELSDSIGCALGMVPNLPAWQAVQERLATGRKPKAVSLTSRLEASIGESDETLERLIAEQEADMRTDPSPFDDDSPDRRTTARERKRM